MNMSSYASILTLLEDERVVNNIFETNSTNSSNSYNNMFCIKSLFENIERNITVMRKELHEAINSKLVNKLTVHSTKLIEKIKLAEKVYWFVVDLIEKKL